MAAAKANHQSAANRKHPGASRLWVTRPAAAADPRIALSSSAALSKTGRNACRAIGAVAKENPSGGNRGTIVKEGTVCRALSSQKNRRAQPPKRKAGAQVLVERLD